MRALRLILGAVLVMAVLAVPVPSSAQAASKMYRIAVLANENTPPWELFRQGLRDLGYVDGRNVTIDWRWSEGRIDRFPALALEVVALKPDIIVAAGTPAGRAAKEATSVIPIVFVNASFPDKTGLVQSLSRPGGNVTGLSSVAAELAGKKLQLLKEIAPKISRMAVLWNPANAPVEPLGFQEWLTAAPAVGVDILSVEVRSANDFAGAFAALAPSRVHALLAHGNAINLRDRHLIADFALKNQLPSIFEHQLFVEAGGLMSYAPSVSDMVRPAVTYVDKILKGAKPADLPVEQPTKFELVINSRTATRSGPDDSTLRAAARRPSHTVGERCDAHSISGNWAGVELNAAADHRAIQVAERPRSAARGEQREPNEP